MPLPDLIKVQLTAAELQQLSDSLATLKAVLQPHSLNLNPEERRKLGNKPRSTEILFQKVANYAQNHPEFSPPNFDLAEFERDCLLAKQLAETELHLQVLMEACSDLRIVAQLDAYQVARDYFRYVRFLSRAQVPGATTAYEDLSKIIVRGGKSSKKKAGDED